MLSKCCWRFAIGRGTLWNEVIRGKCGECKGDWCTLDTRGGFGFLEGNFDLLAVLVAICPLRFGNGQRIKFWKDVWLVNTPLQVSFPLLFALAESKEAWVREFWDDVFGEGGWNPVFTSPFNDWEVDEAESLLCQLGRYTLEEAVNKVRWKLSNTEVFTVKSVYKALQLSTFEPFPLQMI